MSVVHLYCKEFALTIIMDAFIAASCIALLSLVGSFFFRKQSEESASIHRFVIPVAVGVFLSVIFFELIPETLERSHEYGPIAIVVGFLGFYVLSHFLRTFHHHHHESHDDCVGSGARLLLLGDAIHNIADGVVIASAFMVNPGVGIATTIGIALHEIPQEIAEFGVLIASGFSRTRATLYNLLSASSVLLGVLVTFLFEDQFAFIIGIAAGNLLYIAASDLIPELSRSHREHFWQSFLATLIGLVLMWGLIEYSHEHLTQEADTIETHTE